MYQRLLLNFCVQKVDSCSLLSIDPTAAATRRGNCTNCRGFLWFEYYWIHFGIISTQHNNIYNKYLVILMQNSYTSAKSQHKYSLNKIRPSRQTELQTPHKGFMLTSWDVFLLDSWTATFFPFHKSCNFPRYNDSPNQKLYLLPTVLLLWMIVALRRQLISLFSCLLCIFVFLCIFVVFFTSLKWNNCGSKHNHFPFSSFSQASPVNKLRWTAVSENSK